jgi:hypothetical protein
MDIVNVCWFGEVQCLVILGVKPHSQAISSRNISPEPERQSLTSIGSDTKSIKQEGGYQAKGDVKYGKECHMEDGELRSCLDRGSSVREQRCHSLGVPNYMLAIWQCLVVNTEFNGLYKSQLRLEKCIWSTTTVIPDEAARVDDSSFPNYVYLSYT